MANCEVKMTEKELKFEIQKAIKDFSDRTVQQASINLFNTLGYITDRKSPFPDTSFQYFKESFIGTDLKFNEEKAYIEEWKSIDLLFQLTDNEISRQLIAFDTNQVDNTIIETYLFFSIELKKSEYTRTQLAQITREINKVFPMPVLIVFKHGENITLSVINRRLNKKDSQKDVLEKVTVIKDINISSPHRAHIEILFDLSFAELMQKYRFTNFVELHNAWQKTLDTKELNARFYKELSNWYFWALHEVHFPTTNWTADRNSLLKEEDKVKEHNAKNLIRLLTRLLFVWFVKEKNLIPDEIFDVYYIKEKLLKDFEPNKKKGFDHKTQGSKYYRAILQNLFFATLNQTVGKREFRKEGQQMNVTNLMRYESYFKDPVAFVKMVENVVPFMNGGLFECLDSPDPTLQGKNGGDIILYEDGFSDRKDNSLCVPDYIFFSVNEHADLSDELGDFNQNDVTVNGLINILKSYKFTVTENTPIEEDIALDPELLGRVFENLLASYNPETKTTARKKTGSFYTPRDIVNYMVDESIKEYLKQKLIVKTNMRSDDADIALDFLIGYNEKEHLFDEIQTTELINAIDNCKIIDPACGSGAFPMGILHKLVHILHKLDPNNKLWKEKQIEKANLIDDSEIRSKLIEDIETAFESNELDYGRKLYLIENCIYGVDIQPIATQISKLRFFISLVVDQKANGLKENFGIRPLPNLETKFVAANTLIGIEKPKTQMTIFDISSIPELENKLKDIRHRMFSAKTPSTKRRLRDEDHRIREEMSIKLEKEGWSNESANQLTEWDPYNQNVSSNWFDSGWMFGVDNGFDISIGNPPYGADIDSFTVLFEKLYPKTSKGFKEIYKYFFNCSIQNLVKNNGILSFITPNTYFLQPRYGDLRKYLLEYKIISLINLGEDVFEAVVPTAISFICKSNNNIDNSIMFADISKQSKFTGSMSSLQIIRINQRIFIDAPNFIFSDNIRTKAKDEVQLGELLDFKDAGINYQRVNVGLSDKGNSDLSFRLLYEGEKEEEHDVEYWKGTDINAFYISPKTNRFVRTKIHLKNNERVILNANYFKISPKLIWRQTASYPIAVIDRKGIWFGRSIQSGIIKNKFSNIFYYEYICCIMNSTFLRNLYEKNVREGGRVFPQVKLEKLKPLPIKIIPLENQKIFKDLYIKIETDKIKGYQTTDFEKQIDELVFHLYELSDEEISLILKESNR